MRFFGQELQAVDARHRVAIPRSFREMAGAEELRQGLVITRGFDHCLYLFPMRAWEAVAEEFAPLFLRGREVRMLERLFLREAVEVAADNRGRILLPDPLRGRAGIEGEALFIGASARMELWHPPRWAALEQAMRERYEELAEAFHRFFHARRLA